MKRDKRHCQTFIIRRETTFLIEECRYQSRWQSEFLAFLFLQEKHVRYQCRSICENSIFPVRNKQVKMIKWRFILRGTEFLIFKISWPAYMQKFFYYPVLTFRFILCKKKFILIKQDLKIFHRRHHTKQVSSYFIFIEPHHRDWKFRRIELRRMDFLSVRPIFHGNLIARRFSFNQAEKAQETYQVTINTVNRLDALFRPVVTCTR